MEIKEIIDNEKVIYKVSFYYRPWIFDYSNYPNTNGIENELFFKTREDAERFITKFARFNNSNRET